MKRAFAEPTADRYHAWRRSVKDLWLQVRLVEGRCANRLQAVERGLAALDDDLGEIHNVVLLEQILATEALGSRADSAQCLRLLRRYQLELRREARVLGAKTLADTPRAFLRRVKRAWRRASVQPTAGSRTACARTA
jgi:hypothetical protein